MNKATSTINLKNVTLVNNVVVITTNQEWQQEDTLLICRQILKKLPLSKIIEINEGADRVDIRFDYNKTLFIIRFDIYSQSCWLESESSVFTDKLIDVHKTLHKN